MSTATDPTTIPSGVPPGHDGHLTHGWEPDLPLGDSMLRRFLFCWAAATETFAAAAGGRMERTPAFAVADYGRPSGFFNSATLLAPPAGPGGFDVLDEVEGFFAGTANEGSVALWSAWPTPDLAARGWHLEGHPPLLIRPPARLVPPPGPPSVDVADVTDGAGLVDWERVAVEGYPLPELAPFRPGSIADPSLLSDPRLRFAVGYEAGDPVSIGTLFTDAGVGCFTLGVTRPEARGRGHWRAHAIHRLLAAPDLWMTGIFSDDSRPQAERLGFVPLFRFTVWTLSRQAMSRQAKNHERSACR